MSGWNTFLLIVGLLVFVLAIPAGVRVRHCQEGFSLSILYGPFEIRLIPSKKKVKKKKTGKKRKSKAKTPERPKVKREKPDSAKKGGSISALMEYVPIVKDLLNGIRIRLYARKVVIYVNLAGDDPCDLALQYGKTAAAVGCVLPFLERFIRIRKRDIQVFCDFTALETTVYLDIALVISPVRLIWLVLRQGVRFLKTFMKQKSSKAV